METTTIETIVDVPAGILAETVQQTLHTIGKVHLVNASTRVPVFYDNRRFGGYTPDTEEKPRHFEFSPIGPHPKLTIAHEIGHYLDDMLGNFVVYASMEPGSSLYNIVERIRQSDAVGAMQDESTALPIRSPIRFQLLNWLEAPELWARAYAQYIAVKTEEPAFLNDLHVAISLAGPKVFKNVQWDKADFVPILSEIDIAFGELGWLL